VRKGAAFLVTTQKLVVDWEAVTRLVAAWSAETTDKSVCWLPVDCIIEGAWRAQELERRQLTSSLLKSRQTLSPLDDPFLADFGLNQWLSGSREEAYSDWLAWIINQIGDPAAVFRLFGLEVPSTAVHWTGTSADRETPIPDGRLDLVLRWKGYALLVIEVKLTDEGSASTAKQRRYRTWIDEQPEPVKCAVLLVLDAEPGLSEGEFSRIDWRSVCLEIRRTAAQLVKAHSEPAHLVRAALLLAFAGAAEQNLLGMAARPLDLMDNGFLINAVPINSYLAEFHN
jgi:hypothetical protein